MKCWSKCWVLRRRRNVYDDEQASTPEGSEFHTEVTAFCGWEGDYRYAVALAMLHKLSDLSSDRFNSLDREMGIDYARGGVWHLI